MKTNDSLSIGIATMMWFTLLKNVMDCTKLIKTGSMDYILMLDKLYPDEKFEFRKLEVDFDIKEAKVW